MDKYIGKMLDDRYEIIELIGAGGMANVYKAKCHRLNRMVAIKILKTDMAENEEIRRRFQDESRAVAQLSHANIVSVYDVSTSGDTEYIVMELIDGITLKQYMARRGEMDWRESLHFIIQSMRALEHAHSRGIIHRDIKPENLFYDGQKLILADFDIARNTQEEADRDTHILGSLGYAAPEQFGFSQSGPASDFYAVGVLMNVLYTGSLPSVNLYQGPERAIIEKATHINSQKRYQSAQEFKDAITDLGRSSWRLPGFRSHQPARMLMATCGYLLMLFSSFNMEAKGDSAVDRFLLRLSFFMILFMIVLFACNYRNIKDTCLFHSSKSKFVRFCGIIISYLLVATVLTTALAALSVAISSFGL